MKEKPILFSGPMVRSILDGRKTQTRRVIKHPHLTSENEFDPYNGSGAMDDFDCGFVFYTVPKCGDRIAVKCPYGEAGDRLYVRETWWDNCPGYGPDKSQLYYRADGIPDFEGEEAEIRWSPSIHMPRWASRITLEIISVHVQRLTDIDEEDCLREGILMHDGRYGVGDDYFRYFYKNPIAAFAELWDSINGKTYPWELDPWVWVVEFKIVTPIVGILKNGKRLEENP